jgi:hypothetical protein
MARELEFDIPSDKKVRLVVIAIIVVSIVDIAMFGSLVNAEVVPFGRLGMLDRVLLAAPFCGLLWIVFAGFGRKHTAGYYFRYRFGQTLQFVLFYTAITLGTNTVFRAFHPTSYESALGYYFGTLIFMFIVWSLMVSVVAIPIILWRSKRISARSSYQVTKNSHPKSNHYVADPKGRDGSRSDRRTSSNKGSSQSSVEGFKRGDRTQVEKHTAQKPSFQENHSQRPTPYKTQAEKREETEQKVEAETKSVQESSIKKSLTERNKEPIDDSADELYAIAWDEVETGNPDKGLWARLYVKHDADEAKTKVAYIEDRVKILFQQREIKLLEEKRLEKEHQEKENIRLEEERLEEHRIETERREEEQQKQENEEEEKLLATLRGLSPMPMWKREDYFGHYIQLKHAIRQRDSDKVLRLICSGADPTGLLTDSDENVTNVLASNKKLRHIITVAIRLRSKKIVNVDGIKE